MRVSCVYDVMWQLKERAAQPIEDRMNAAPLTAASLTAPGLSR